MKIKTIVQSDNRLCIMLNIDFHREKLQKIQETQEEGEEETTQVGKLEEVV